MEKIKKPTIIDENLRKMGDAHLEALAKVDSAELREALSVYIERRKADINDQLAKLYMYPKQKNMGTLFELQDLQSKITELVRFVDLFGKANKILMERRKSPLQT